MRRHIAAGKLATVVSDLDRRRVVEVLDGRSRRVVERYLRSLSAFERNHIRIVSIDPYEPYRTAIRAALPDARGRTTSTWSAAPTPRWTRSGARASARPPAASARAAASTTRGADRLLRARERLTARQRHQLCELFAHEPLIAEAWGLKEAFRSVYHARDRADAERRLDAFLAAGDRAQIPSFTAFADGLGPWREELVAYFDQPTTNGYAEGV